MDGAGTLYVGDTINYTMRSGKLALVVNLSFGGGQVTVSWPQGLSNCVLQTRSSLGGNWTSISNGITASGDSYYFTTNSSAPSGFFRVRQN